MAHIVKAKGQQGPTAALDLEEELHEDDLAKAVGGTGEQQAVQSKKGGDPHEAAIQAQHDDTTKPHGSTWDLTKLSPEDAKLHGNDTHKPDDTTKHHGSPWDLTKLSPEDAKLQANDTHKADPVLHHAEADLHVLAERFDPSVKHSGELQAAAGLFEDAATVTGAIASALDDSTQHGNPKSGDGHTGAHDTGSGDADVKNPASHEGSNSKDSHQGASNPAPTSQVEKVLTTNAQALGKAGATISDLADILGTAGMAGSQEERELTVRTATSMRSRKRSSEKP